MTPAQQKLFDAWTICTDLHDYAAGLIRRQERANPLHVQQQMSELMILLEQIDEALPKKHEVDSSGRRVPLLTARKQRASSAG